MQIATETKPCSLCGKLAGECNCGFCYTCQRLHGEDVYFCPDCDRCERHCRCDRNEGCYPLEDNDG